MSNVLGIDIGVGSIKVVSLTKVADKYILDTLGETKTPRVDWLKGESRQKAMAEIEVSLKSLLNDLKVKATQVVTCLPEDVVISRLIRLPPLKESEIRDALKFEAETFIPYPLNEVSIDYEVVEVDESKRLAVFAIAARNDMIQSYIKMFKNVGLGLTALESPAMALTRAVTRVITNSGLLIVDMGERFSDIVGVSSKKVYFTRSMSVGGESLTRAISVNLGLDMASAEEYKKAYGMKETDLEGKIKTSILPVFNSMAEEVRKVIQLFREEYSKVVEIIVLSGGGANLPGFAEELTKLLGVEVQVTQPFLETDSSKINLPIDLNSDGCRFTLAVGLALRGLV